MSGWIGSSALASCVALILQIYKLEAQYAIFRFIWSVSNDGITFVLFTAIMIDLLQLMLYEDQHYFDLF